MKVTVSLGRRGLIPVVVGLLMALMVSGAPVLAANGLTNGDFEDTPNGLNGWFVNVFSGTSANAAAVSSFSGITPQYGAAFAKMSNESGSSSLATISQDFPALPGGKITGYYWFIPDTTAGAPAQSLRIGIGPTVTDAFPPVTTATGAWVPFTYTLLPADVSGSPPMSTITLLIDCDTPGSCPNQVAAFDNFQYTDPPSPTTATAVTNTTATYSGSAQNVTLNAQVTAASTVNEGTVTFTVKQGATQIGVPVTSGTVTNNAASASFSLPGGTAAGGYTINAVYNPSSATFTTSSGSGTLTVNKANTSETVPNVTTTFSGSAQNVTLSATVNSTTPVNEGTVKFSVRQGVSTIIGSPVTSGTVTNGAASVTYSLPGNTPVGGYSIDAVYNAAASNPNFQGLTGNSGTLTINANPTPVVGLTNPDFEMGVTGWQGFGTGGSNNQFNVIVHTSVTSTITKGGTTITPQSLTKFGELDSITGGNAPAVIYQNISVLPGGTLTGYYYFVPDSGVGANPNAALQIELLACDPNGAPPCTLAFPTVSSFVVNTTAATGGWVPFTFTFPSGPYTTWALNLVLNCPTAGGTESCPNAAAAFDNFVYTLPTTTTAVTDTTTPFSATAQNVTLNATVSSASPVNEGTVTFTVKQGATTIGAPMTSSTVTNGAASVTYALPAGTPTGPYTINAVYNIAPTNTKFQGSSGSGTLTVAPDATTLAVTNVTTPFSAAAQNVTLTATVTSTSAVNEGTVTFTVKQGATTIGAPVTSATVASGLASVMYALPANTPGGAYTISAVYNPAATTPEFQTSTSTGTLTVTGNAVVTLTGLAVSAPSKFGSPPTIKVGQQMQLTATATFSDGSTPDVTSQAQWSPNSAAAATVNATTGIVTGQYAGTTTITATYTVNGVTRMATITVTVGAPVPFAITVPIPQGRSANLPSSPLAVGVPAAAPGGR